MKVSLLLTLAVTSAGDSGEPVPKALQDEFKVMARFAGAAGGKRIFDNQGFNVHGPVLEKHLVLNWLLQV